MRPFIAKHPTEGGAGDVHAGEVIIQTEKRHIPGACSAPQDHWEKGGGENRRLDDMRPERPLEKD